MHTRDGRAEVVSGFRLTNGSLRAIVLCAAALLCSLITSRPVSAQGWPNGYAHRHAITISHTQVPNTDQTNFPLLFSGTYSFLATTANGGQVTNTNGYDIVFTSDAAGANMLAFEQEHYSGASGAVSYWISIPTLSHSTDTVIYMFYGNSSISTDQSDKTAVWDSNYKGVWHLPNGTTLSATDSTVDGYNGTVNGATAMTGMIDGGAGLSGGSQYITMGNALNMGTGPLTLEAWVKAPNTSLLGTIIGKRNNSSPWQQYDLVIGYTNSSGFGVAGKMISFFASGGGNSSTWESYYTSSNVVDGNWHHVAVTRSSSGTVSIYADGVSRTLTTVNNPSSVPNGDNTSNFNIGYDNGSGYLDAYVDEVKVSNTARSADWIATEYNNQSRPSTFYSIDSGDWSNGYTYRSTITIAHAEVPNTDQADFPLLFTGTYSYLSTTTNGGSVTNSNGYDIVFTSDPAGLSPLAYERESYNPSTGAVIYWIQVPIVSHSSDTNIYMFYGNSLVTTDQSNKTGVWDSHYEAVWHLPNGASLSASDSTSNAANGTNSGMTATSGQIDGAAAGDGGNGHQINTSNNPYPSAVFSSNGLTLSAWVQPASIPSGNPSQIVSLEGAYLIDVTTGGKLGFEINGTGHDVTSSISVPNNSWTYIVGTSDSSGNLTTYVNGVASTTGSQTFYNLNSLTRPYTLGGHPTLSGYNFKGVMDEVRISNTARSADWITTEYNNQSSPSTFYSVSSTLQAPSLSSLSPSSGASGTSVTIAGNNFGSSQGSSTVTFTGLIATPTSWSNTQIVAPVPVGTLTGDVLVTVSNLASNSLTFTDSTPTILELSPPSGPLTGSVEILGGGFGPTQGTSTVTFNGTAATPTSWSNTEIVVPVPIGASSGNVVVTIAGTPSNAANFTVTVPTITSLSPSSGLVGTSVTIAGSSFGLTQGSSTVTFNGVAATPTSWSSTSIVVPVPTAASTGNVVVTVGGVASAGVNFTVTPSITSLSPSNGIAGVSVTIAGNAFAPAQGSSTVKFNGTSATPTSWSDTSIVVPVPGGATSGNVIVTVAGANSNSAYFTTVPNGWTDQDIGAVGTAGNASYSNGVFTVNGAGSTIGGTADSFNFLYQQLSGDGSIIARMTSLQGGSYNHLPGLVIRNDLTAGSADAVLVDGNNGAGYFYFGFNDRATAGGSTSGNGGNSNYNLWPYWVQLTRSGNTFTAYTSVDGTDWTQSGSSVTVSMNTNVYVGMGISSNNTSSLGSVTFDNVSISTPSTPAPSITSISATTGQAGLQIVIGGSGFGSSQSGSLALLNGTPLTINSWSGTSITATIPTGATSGYIGVAVAPSMNSTNVVYFTVESNPLPDTWLDADIGAVGTTGNATYANGTFTINGAGDVIGRTADAFHFVYQPLSGDGTIIARLVSLQGGVSNHSAALMVRETMAAGATNANADYVNNGGGYFSFSFGARLSTNASMTGEGGSPLVSLPYWVKLTRTGSSFSAFTSPDGVYWTQIGSAVTVSMASNVYVGMGVTSNIANSLATATFDNVTTSGGEPTPSPVITSVSPTVVTVGTSVTINGHYFGATQGSGSVLFNGATASSVTGWSDSQIVAQVPGTASTGPVTVIANGLGSNGVSVTFYNPVITSVTPPAAPIGGTVTVAGSGFGAYEGQSTINFNNIALQTEAWSDTSITISVPANATSGAVTVVEGGIASNAVAFTVLESTSITGVSPSSGPVGTAVTISGTGFGPTQSTSVISLYGATATNITSWSDTSIVATVPLGAATGPISVTIAGNTTSGSSFNLTSSVTLTDSLGNSSSYAASETGGQWVLTSSEGSGCSTCTTRGVINDAYDNNGNKLSETDALGNVTTYTYDSRNDVLTQTAAAGSTIAATNTYTYNAFGEVLTATDPLGHVTTNTYDANGNLTSVTTPAPGGGASGSVTQFAYNSLGELTQITDPLNNLTTMTYTSAGLIATITDAQNHVTTYGYDTHGNRTSVTDANNQTTTFTYDTGDRLTKITYPDTSTTSFAYDIRGRRTSVTDQNNRTTTYAYDGADRLTSVTDPASNVTTYAYDTEDNLVTITDANTHSTIFSYDAYGRVKQTNFPSSQSEYYQYDADNNLTSKTDRNGNTINYVYDALNRLTQKTYPDTTNVEYTYDLVGKVLQVNDPTGTYAFAYDNMGRLIGTTTNYSFLTSRAFTTSYAYDTNSNRTGFTDPEGGATTYSYDTLNRLTSLAPPSAFGSGSFGFSYDALSRRTQMTRPNGVTTNYSYDNLSRLLSVLHQVGTSTIDGAAYTLDAAGNRTSKADYGAGVTSNYTYDQIYELTKVTQAANTTENYSYDPVGNRLSSLAGSFTVSNWNQLTASPTASYTYDNNGNMLTKTAGSNTTTYAWDYENRLTSVTLPETGGTVTFKYDPFGRRIEKVSPAFMTIFAYDGDNLVETVNSGGAVVSRYSQTQNIDEPLAELRSSTTSYYEADGLGTTTSLTNAAGALANGYTYDSFGNLTASSGSVSNPFQYTGREFDSETSLYYYRARYYDQTTGRFTSEDPLRFGSGPDFYEYALNDPTGYVDPSGLWPKVLMPPWSRTRPCSASEYSECAQICGAKGVESCRVSQTFRVTRAPNGFVTRSWVDGPMSCSCNPEDPEDCPNSAPKPTPAPSAKPLGGPIPPIIILEDILEGLAAAAAL